MNLCLDNRRSAVLLLAALLALGVAGCRKPGALPGSGLLAQDLSPDEFQRLPDRDQVRYRDIVIRVPHTFYGVLPPTHSGVYPSILDKMVHTGDLVTLMGLYNQALFEAQHPRVKVEYISFDMWSENFRSALAVAMSAGRAPSFYVARDLPETINQGIYADITDLVRRWDQFGRQPEAAYHEGMVNGRTYTVAKGELSALVIRYRKDWFREAGIFNEHGEPGPPSDWTWQDFRRYARMLTRPDQNRYGFVGETRDFLFNDAHGIEPLYIPDPTGRRTWVFNDQEPLLLESLKNAREMVNKEKSVYTSVSMNWFEWHAEFDASHAAMIVSWAAHPPRESLEQPFKFGKDKPFRDVVGMVPPPRGRTGLTSLKQICDLVGFDPTLHPRQLEAAFEWFKASNYGVVFLNRIRQEAQEARVKGRRPTLYAAMLSLPYEPAEQVLDEPFERVFPPDYLRTFEAIRKSRHPPLPREFGLREPPRDALYGAVKSLYSDAINTTTDLRLLVARHANIINTNLLNFRGPDDRANHRRYVDALTAFYRQCFPRYYETEWRRKLQTYFRAP